MAAENDLQFDENSEKGGQDVQSSGWFEVKKKNRSGSKSFTSKSAGTNRTLIEAAKKRPIHSRRDGVVESDPPLSPVYLTDREIANQEVPENSMHTMLLQSPGKMELVNTASVAGTKPETSFDGKNFESCDGISSKKHPVSMEHGVNTKDADNLFSHSPMTSPKDAPRFKWGNLDEEDLKQTQEVELNHPTKMDDSSKLGTSGKALDSTICLEGGKQSSAKELKDMKIEEASLLVGHGNFPSNSSKSPYSQPQVCQYTEEATEEGVNSISQHLSILDGNPCHIPLLNSTLTHGSSKRPCEEEQVESELVDNTLTNKITLHTAETPDSVGHVAAGDSVIMFEAKEPMQCQTADYEKMVDGEKSGKERSMDFSLAASMLMDKFEESESGESKERFRQRLWCYLFENLNRAIDELYFLCELECDMEQIQEVLLVLNEAGLDFTELKSRVDGFDKVKNLPSMPRTLAAGNDGNSLSAKVEHRRPHAIAWEVRRMACSPNRAEILSSSLETFKKVQQETAQKHSIRQGKRRDAARLLPIEQGGKELSSKPASSKELGSSVKEAVMKSKGKQSPLTNCNDSLNRASINVEKKKADVLKVNKDSFINPDAIPNFDSSTISVPKVTMGLKKDKCMESCESQDSNSVSKVGCKIVQQMPAESVNRAVKTARQIDKINKALEFSERRVSIAEREKEKKWPKIRASLDAWKEKRNWEDILSSPLRSSARTSRSPITGRKSTERARVLHDKLMSPEKKKKSPSEMKKEVDDKQARATRIRRELENERVQRLQRTTEKLNRVSEWQAVRSTKLREGMHARQQRGESRHEAHLAQIARRASDESSKVSEVRFITSLNEENKKLSLQQKLQDSELRRAERLQIIKIKQKEDVAREEAVLERRRLLEAERLQRIAETQRKKEEATARREEERKAASAAREARAVEQVRKKEVRAKVQQEEAELLAQRLTEKLRESELRRKVYLEQIRERAAMESRDQASPSMRRPSSRDGQLRTVVGQANEIDIVIDKEVGSGKLAAGSKGINNIGPGISTTKLDNSLVQHQALKKRVKKIRQRLMARKYEFPEPPIGNEGVGIGSTSFAGAARSKIGRWLQDLQRLQQARKAGTSGVGLIIGEMVKYLEGKEAELHAARQAGLLDFVAAALPASHTSKPEASQTTISLLRILKVLLALPANRSYFIARNLLPPLIPMLSTALENFSRLGSSSVNCIANVNTLSTSADKPSADERLEAVGEVLGGLLWCVTAIMGHACTDERQLQMEDDLAELVVACEVIHRLRDLFALFDRPQIEGSPFPAPVLLGLNLLQTLTSPRGKLSAAAHDEVNIKLQSPESRRTAAGYDKDVIISSIAESVFPRPENRNVKEEAQQCASISTTIEPNQLKQCDEVDMKLVQDLQGMSECFGSCEDNKERSQDACGDVEAIKTSAIELVNMDGDSVVKGGSEVEKLVMENPSMDVTFTLNTKAASASAALAFEPVLPVVDNLKVTENNKGDKGYVSQGSAFISRCTGFLVIAIAETGLVGLPSLLTAVLLQTNPRSTPEQAAAVLPSNFEEVATSVLKVLNNLARSDLALVQNLLAMPDLQMEFFHLVSFLLSHCTCKWKNNTDQVASLLFETLLLLGYFALLHPGNQAVLRWGKSPTILHKICDLPFAFFSDPQLTPVLVGTLLAVCYGSERNRDVVQQELSMDMLLALLKSSKDEVAKQRQLRVSQEGFQPESLSNAVPNQGSLMDAILEESEEEMQQVQENDELSMQVREEGKKVPGDVAHSETEASSRRIARSTAGKLPLLDSASSLNKKTNKNTSKNVLTSEGEPFSKDLTSGRGGNSNRNTNKGSISLATSDNAVSQMKKIKGTISTDGSAKTSNQNFGVVYGKRGPMAVSQDQLPSMAYGISCSEPNEAKDGRGNFLLPSAFLLQNRFPVSLLDLAQDFFSVGH